MSLPTTKAAQLSIRSFFQVQSSPPKPANLPPPPPPPPPSSSSLQPGILPHDAPTQTQLEATPGIPPQAAIRSIRQDDITPLRRLNALLLPVSYNDAFYLRAADPSTAHLSRVMTWSHADQTPAIVGAVVCRLEPPQPPPTSNLNSSNSSSSSSSSSSNHNANSETIPVLYIQSLCLLSPYRAMGLATAALDSILTDILNPSHHHPPIRAITAHVWTENEEGLHWYEARGFQRLGDPIQGYYIKLRPASAWLVSRPVSAPSLLQTLPHTGTTQPQPRIPIAGTTAAVLNLPDGDAECAKNRPEEGRSYQKQRPDGDWNDLPDDMNPGLLAPRRGGSEGNSSASSRSSSAVRKKRDRSYPVAAFGNS